MIALLDADVLAYQAAASVEHAVDWGDGLWTLHAFEQDAAAKFDSMVNTVLDAVAAESSIFAFTDKENWRKNILPTYKANRSGTRKPMLLQYLRERTEALCQTYIRPTLEGDDCLGILATLKSTGPCIVCSIDKDFKTIPGKHYNFGKDEFFEITVEEADYWHMFQTLTGDSTDGYAGCPGIGPVTAKKILDKAEGDLWSAVVQAYEKAGLSEEEALVQARVARILRATDYDFKNKEPILWTPPPNTK